MPRKKPEIKVTVEFCNDMEPEEALAGWVRATQILMRTAERMEADVADAQDPMLPRPGQRMTSDSQPET